MSATTRIVVAYHSGYGHTQRVAEAIGRGASSIEGAVVEVLSVDGIAGRMDTLDAADAIIMGAPTYMGGLSAPFKAFMDATSRPQYTEKRWEGKIAAGFTNSGSRAGDKQNSLLQLMTFAAQHHMHWVSLGLGYGNNRTNTNDEIMNRDTYSIGLGAQSNVDQDAELAPPPSDLRTAEFLGRRVAEFTRVVVAGRAALGVVATGVEGGAEVQDPERRGIDPR